MHHTKISLLYGILILREYCSIASFFLSCTQQIVRSIILSLELIHLCSAEALEQYVFDNSHEVASILLHYIHAPYQVVWLYSKANLIHIGKLLDPRVLEVLALTETAFKEFSANLFNALDNPLLLLSISGGTMTANELLNLFIDATLYEDNCNLMMCEELLQCFPLLLQNDETKVTAARLMWTLVQRESLRQRVKDEAPLLLQIVQEEATKNITEDLLGLLAICFNESSFTGNQFLYTVDDIVAKIIGC